jgi:hypothetical protein
MSAQLWRWPVKPHWYAVHSLFAFKIRGRARRNVTVFENVYLVKARTSVECVKKMSGIVKRETSDDPSLAVDGKPAKIVFVGHRKVVRCAMPVDKGKTDVVFGIVSGMEATYSVLRVDTRVLRALAKGKEVRLVYEE